MRPNSSIITKTGRHVDQISADKVLMIKEQEQVREYLDSLDMNDPQNRQTEFIYDLMINTGLRETELATLRLRDCPVYHNADAILVYQGKGNKDRTISLSDRLCKKLQAYIDEIRPKTIPRWMKGDMKRPVFFNLHKKPFVQICEVKRLCKVKGKKKKEVVTKQLIRASRTLYRMIINIGQQAGITKRLCPKILRHTFATNAIREGKITLPELMAYMGHTRIEMTARYVHVAALEMKGRGEALDNG